MSPVKYWANEFRLLSHTHTTTTLRVSSRPERRRTKGRASVVHHSPRTTTGTRKIRAIGARCVYTTRRAFRCYSLSHFFCSSRIRATGCGWCDGARSLRGNISRASFVRDPRRATAVNCLRRQRSTRYLSKNEWKRKLYSPRNTFYIYRHFAPYNAFRVKSTGREN